MSEGTFTDLNAMIQDELAEMQIPEPGYAGTRAELDMEDMDDFDVFNYWDDLEYGDDAYWDQQRLGAATEGTNKRKAGSAVVLPEKRRKMSLVETGGGSVRFVTNRARQEMQMRKPAAKSERPTFSLLADWRTRFAGVDGMSRKKEMPAAMRSAAEAINDDGEVGLLSGEYEHDVHEDDGSDDPALDLASLDPEMLKTVLRQKLGDAGLEGMDEAAMMQMIGNMLSGNEDADDAADDLTNNLLTRATEGNDTALSGWLAEQGVSLDDDTTGNDEAELPDVARSNGNDLLENSASAQRDLAKVQQDNKGHGRTSLPVLGKRRAALPSPLGDTTDRKRSRTYVEAPRSSLSTVVSQHDSVVDAQEAEQIDSNIPEVPSNKDTPGVGLAINAKSIPGNTRKAAKEAGSGSSLNGKLPQPVVKVLNGHLEEKENASAVAASTPVKGARKRKAEVEKSTAKKQARTVSGLASTAGKRTTRATRSAAKTGK